MSSGRRRQRVLNPSFAAAHGLVQAGNGTGGSHCATANTPASNRQSLVSILKRAQDTGKLLASNCADLNENNQKEDHKRIPNACFEFPFQARRYMEEMLTVVDFSDNEEALEDSFLDPRILRYKSVQSLRFRNCGLKLSLDGPPLSLASLEHLSILDLSGNRIEGVLNINEFLPSSLVELNLSKNRIVGLAVTGHDKNRLCFPNLQVLDVSHNPPLKGLFENDCEDTDSNVSMENLRILRCHHNSSLSFSRKSSSDESLPSFLLSAKSSLEILDASHNPKLWTLHQSPMDVSAFEKLHTIDLGLSKLEQIPCIPHSVHTLDLRSNKLTSITGLFPKPTNDATQVPPSKLLDLILAENYIARLDTCVLESMVDLRRVDLSLNKLLVLPYQLGFLKNLSVLDVSGNPVVTKFPDSVIENTRGLLEVLRKRAPEESCGAKSTSVLSASSTLLTAALSSKGYKTFDLEGKLLKHASLAELSMESLLEGLVNQLEASPRVNQGITGSLILDSNRLETLPQAFLAKSFPNVQKISMANNAFTSIPSCFRTMCSHNVKTLLLARNRITSASLADAGWFQPNKTSSLWSLRSITHLDLSLNRLTKFPIHTCSSVHCFPGLEVLNLSCNAISTLEDWKRLPASLRHLDLSENSIEDARSLAIALASDCPNLEYVNLENNKVRKIPNSFGLLSIAKQMHCLNLRGNPQRTIRSQVLDFSCADLLKYLSDRMNDSDRREAMEAFQKHRKQHREPFPGERSSLDQIKADLPKDRPQESSSSSSQNRIGSHSDLREELLKNMNALKEQLKDPSLSEAKKYALKKSLAMEKSKLIRAERLRKTQNEY